MTLPEPVDDGARIAREARGLLAERGLMFLNEKTVHNYPFGWRTGDPLIYYAKEAWYIKTTAIKDRLVELNCTIKWVPETIRDGRFGNWLENKSTFQSVARF